MSSFGDVGAPHNITKSMTAASKAAEQDAFKYTTDFRNYLDTARLDRTIAENRLQDMESYLGSDMQRDPEAIRRLSPYSTMYGYETPSLAGVISTANLGKEKRKTQWETQVNAASSERSAVINRMNELQSQAYAAAQAGDTEQADQFKAQAEQLGADFDTSLADKIRFWKPNVSAYLEGEGGTYEQVINALSIGGTGQETLKAEALLSPIGQTVGDLVRRGKGLATPGSEEWESTRKRLIDPALEQAEFARRAGQSQLISGKQEGERRLAQAGQARGAARTVLGEQANAQREAEQTYRALSDFSLNVGQIKAGLQQNVNQFMEQYAPAFAMDTAALGRAYAQDSPYIRENFQNALYTITAANANFSSMMAQLKTQLSDQLLGMAHEARLKIGMHSAENTMKGIELIAGGFSGGGGGQTGANPASGK